MQGIDVRTFRGRHGMPNTSMKVGAFHELVADVYELEMTQVGDDRLWSGKTK